MNKDRFEEDPLDSLLDEQSETAFGVPEFRDRYEHGARENIDGNLQNWSAEDFSSIFVRFRPHLLRHAKRYLTDETKAEEVVQESFLYLMTSLPEIDTELGVLKFLKWKVRMLSYDVLRASSKNVVLAVDSFDDLYEPQESPDFVERAEDVAIIRLALAKLSPRHREVLVANVYEEKSLEAIAKQLDLKPNAARQLLHRARRAFKLALIGEAETQGLSIYQVLTIAAKKAASEGKRSVSTLGILLFVAIVGFANFPMNTNDDVNRLVASPPSPVPVPLTPQEPFVGQEDGSRDTPSEGSEAQQNETGGSDRPTGAIETEASVMESSGFVADLSSEPVKSAVSEDARFSNEQETLPVVRFEQLSTVLSTNVTNAGIYTESYAAVFGEMFDGVSVEVFGGTGISAFLDLDPRGRTVDQVLFQFNVDGAPYVAVARELEIERLPIGSESSITISAKDFYVVGTNLRVSSNSPLASASATLKLQLDENGSPTIASMTVSS